MTTIDWFSNYFNQDILTENKFLKDIMETTKNTNNINSKIEVQEKNYFDKIQELKDYNIEEINKDLENTTSLEIIQKELEIIKLISKYSLQNNKIELNFIKKILNILLELSNILRLRINQNKITIEDTKNTNILSRCSYKFCNFKENCSYNYSTKKKKNNFCYQDHYVHNMVCYDISVLINYLENNFENEDFIKPNKDILKSINTLSFVINHMENELRAKCIYLETSEWDKNHYNNIKKNICKDVSL